MGTLNLDKSRKATPKMQTNFKIAKLFKKRIGNQLINSNNMVIADPAIQHAVVTNEIFLKG